MNRVIEHPILGKIVKGRPINFDFDGQLLPAFEGEPIAAALLANGIRVHRTTAKTGQPRGIFCGIGRCTDCVMNVDGVPNTRTCITPVTEGMKVRTQEGLQARSA